MKKARLIQKIIILVLVLFVPGFLYYLLVVEGTNRYKPLRKFGDWQLAKTTHRSHGRDIPDTVYHTLNDFKLTNQDGRKVSLKDFDKKIFIADFFYSGCPTVCRDMNENMNQVAGHYAKDKMISFVSISVNPDDTAPVLKKYAATFKPLSPNWMFLTGDTATVYNLARKGFLVDAVQTGKNDFIYSDKLILIDQDKHIRGYYTGASTVDVTRLNDEIKVLISEEINKNDTPEY